ncbi:hypothetical protein LP419_39710 [Massilia sp. H-1]|nr:hypothetical protein LP419_39710 [Massilia sp. H-1]
MAALEASRPSCAAIVVCAAGADHFAQRQFAGVRCLANGQRAIGQIGHADDADVAARMHFQHAHAAFDDQTHVQVEQ